jgi:ABC-2 type transport system ATP-binding protein
LSAFNIIFKKWGFALKKIIEVENLTKKYGSFVAVDNISFEAEEGEVVAFLGPNGAGKTTTMRILTCFMPANEGTARVDGYDIFDDSFKVRQRIGYLPEFPPLYPDMTVTSFLRFVAQIKQVPNREIEAKKDKVIEQCGLEEMKTRMISKLSKGYKQRVGVAQAIIHDPKVIILDEPTVGLDPNQVIEIRSLIKSLAESKTVLLSTHILSEAETLCKHIVIIDKGKIVGKGSWSEMQEHLQEMDVVILVLDAVDDHKIESIRAIDVVKDIKKDNDGNLRIYCDKGSGAKDRIIRLTSENNWSIEEIRSEKMTLEEVFKRLTIKEKV